MMDNVRVDSIMAKEKLKKIIKQAINRVMKRDHHLLIIDTHEITIANKFAHYLQELLPEYNVDIEYNRNLTDQKLSSGSARPDVVVHHRGTNKNNVLVIEIKKSTSDDKHPNIERYLEEPTLRYQHGLYLEFGVGKNYGKNKLKWLPEIKELSKHD